MNKLSLKKILVIILVLLVAITTIIVLIVLSNPPTKKCNCDSDNLIISPTPISQATRDYKLGKNVSVYLPWWAEGSGFESLIQNQNYISTVHPFWYTFNLDGELETFNGINQEVLDYTKTDNMLVIPSISNDFDLELVRTVLSSAELRAKHITAIADLVMHHGFDGIDIDYESLEATDRNIYSTFISELAILLHGNNKLLTVAVHAKTSDQGTWGGPASQDWDLLSKYVDKVTIMTYDYHWSTSEAGDIAPLDWMEDVVEYALTEFPPEKIQLGIHFYGYDWVGKNAKSVEYSDVQDLITEYSITNIQTSNQMEKYFTYTDEIQHTVYFADYETVQARLNIVTENNLGGISIWHIGSEDQRIWDNSISTL